MATLDEDYGSEEILVLRVENKLFKVPKSIFDESEVFQHTLSLPQPDDQPREGSSIDVPFALEGIACTDFKSFLKLFLPVRTHIPITSPPIQLSKSEWISVLHLSTMWTMPSLRADAIATLTDLVKNEVEKLTLAEKYDVGVLWTLPALQGLINRANSLSVEDMRQIGFDYTAKIVALRERRLKGLAQVNEGTQKYVFTRGCRCNKAMHDGGSTWHVPLDYQCSSCGTKGDLAKNVTVRSVITNSQITEQDVRSAFGMEEEKRIESDCYGYSRGWD